MLWVLAIAMCKGIPYLVLQVPHLQVRYRRRASVRVMSFGLPCWASREQAGKSKMQNWVWRGLAKFARRVPHARFCPGVRADSISETMLPGLNWWAYIILTV